jgi:hypothetical protein
MVLREKRKRLPVVAAAVPIGLALTFVFVADYVLAIPGRTGVVMMFDPVSPLLALAVMFGIVGLSITMNRRCLSRMIAVPALVLTMFLSLLARPHPLFDRPNPQSNMRMIGVSSLWKLGFVVPLAALSVTRGPCAVWAPQVKLGRGLICAHQRPTGLRAFDSYIVWVAGDDLANDVRQMTFEHRNDFGLGDMSGHPETEVQRLFLGFYLIRTTEGTG